MVRPSATVKLSPASAISPNAANPACAYRCGETPTRFTYIPVNELGAAAHWNQPLGAGLLLIAGADVHDVRIWDREQTYGSSAALTNLHDHQRDSAAYVQALWVHNAWTLAASARMDWFQNYDGRQLLWSGAAWTPTATQPTQRDERIFDPRLGLSRKLSAHWAVSASGFRAFRAPTPSELYRSTQVGNKLTNPNGNLLSERATGWETGIATQWNWGTIRISYFLTQVNRPIVAVTVNPNFFADFAGPRKSRPDRESRPRRRLRTRTAHLVRAQLSLTSTAAINTPTPPSAAAR